MYFPDSLLTKMDAKQNVQLMVSYICVTSMDSKLLLLKYFADFVIVAFAAVA